MADNKDFDSSVREYWEDPNTISIVDRNLHKIEIDTVLRYLRPSDKIADIGCGNGEATVKYAAKVKECTGYERSSLLRQQAEKNAKASGVSNLTITNGDILHMPQIEEKYDAIVTQRMLINLSTWEDQKQALSNIHDLLRPGGLYLMIENTNDAFLSLNDMRAEVDLAPIPQH